MNWSDLLSRLGRDSGADAFLYVAEVGVTVEYSAFLSNPTLSLPALKEILSPAPEWLRGDRRLLSSGWPEIPGSSPDQLVYLALLSCKAMLALGAIVPDGPLEQMQQEFLDLFPGLADARRSRNREEFQTAAFHVAIDASGSHSTRFGYGPGRPGRPLPIPNPHVPFTREPNTWTAWEIAMKNLLRQDLQLHIDAMAYPFEREGKMP